MILKSAWCCLSLSAVTLLWLLVCAVSVAPSGARMQPLCPQRLCIVGQRDDLRSKKLTRGKEAAVRVEASSSALPFLLGPSLDFPRVFSAAFAGAFSCSFTHSIMVPLDFMKTKMQSNTHAAGEAFNFRRMFTGLSATFTGYFLQGGFKFGFYEVLKIEIKSKFHAHGIKPWEIPVLVGASAIAETIASFALCPLEVTKIFMMLNPDRAQQGMSACIRSIFAVEGLGGLYKGLPWVLMRQLPYTCVKLVGYDIIHRHILELRAKEQEQKQEQEQEKEVKSKRRNKSPALTPHYELDGPFIQGLSGVLAGLLAALVSQPADVILSQVCSRSSTSAASCLAIDTPAQLLQYMVQDLGLKGCFSGLAPRAVMVATMTAMQFVVYENTKQWTLATLHRASSMQEERRLRAREKREE